jgi:hypothetical protein
VDGRDVAVRAEARLPFLPGHEAVFVLRGRQPIFAMNETTGEHLFVRMHILQGEGFVLGTSLFVFIAGCFGFFLMGGGAPIGQYVIPMLLQPFLAWIWSVMARRKIKARVWELAGWSPA